MSNHSASKFELSRWFKTRQEQRLAMALAFVIVCAGAYRVFATGQGLWASQYASIAALTSQIQLLEAEIRDNDNAMITCLTRRRVSLPSDTTLAATRYYTWLHELTSKHGWTDVKIDSTSPTSETSAGERITHSIQARASIEAIGKWLDEFQGYPLLHGLTNLQVIDYSPMTGEARIQLNVETLSLNQAPPDLQLAVSDSSEPAEQRLAASLIQNNPFRRYEPPKPVSVTPEVVVPQIDPLSKIKFIGIVAQDTRTQAWFFDSLQNREVLVPVGSPLTVNGFEGQLNKLDQDCATLEHQGLSVQVHLGQDLRSAIAGQQTPPTARPEKY